MSEPNGTQEYCPYCNRSGDLVMTDEHVIPDSIGGDRHGLIRVCQDCNSIVGARVDTSLSRYPDLRMMAWMCGEVMSFHDRIKVIAQLKDGRMLEGFGFFTKVGPNKARTGFQPRREQPDGSIWIHEGSWNPNLPGHINVLREDMINRIRYSGSPPETAGLESAMVKILLGMIYFDQGKELVRRPAFNVLRNCLGGTLDPRISYRWLTESTDQNFLFKSDEHQVWFQCPDTQSFLGGVSLFGRVTLEIRVSKFGCFVPGRTLVRNVT